LTNQLIVKWRVNAIGLPHKSPSNPLNGEKMRRLHRKFWPEEKMHLEAVWWHLLTDFQNAMKRTGVRQMDADCRLWVDFRTALGAFGWGTGGSVVRLATQLHAVDNRNWQGTSTD